MEGLDYQEIYKLQDEVLEIVFSVEKEFYLTGGTCLNRFYQEKRYSDDLDFFTNDSSRFFFAIKNIKNALESRFKLNSILEAKSFHRMIINQVLQIDFVNDIPYRFKEPIVKPNGYLIDNVENILSNKLTAILGRDNPKDIFDIYVISVYYNFHWKEILESVRNKINFQVDDLIVRLTSFPISLFSQIKIIDQSSLSDFEHNFPLLIEEIIEQSQHSALL